MKRSPSLQRRAFTLIELLLVLVILAVLAAVVIPKLTGRVEDARIKGTIAELSNLKTAMETFEADNGRYPTSGEGLAALVYLPAGLDNTWHGKYIDNVPEDKWGHEYHYAGPEEAGERQFNIVSAGPDGNFNTGDDLYAIPPDN
jgi:general secretion pathway protein G